jgi:hypothetical protein
MREGTTSRVTVADRPCGEFYDFYSVSLENFGYRLVFKATNYILTIDLKFDMKHFLFLIMTDYFLVSCSSPMSAASVGLLKQRLKILQ